MESIWKVLYCVRCGKGVQTETRPSGPCERCGGGYFRPEHPTDLGREMRPWIPTSRDHQFLHDLRIRL